MRRSILLIFAAILYVSAYSQNFEAKFNIKGVRSKNIYVTVFGDKDNATINYADPAKPVINAENGVFTISGKVNNYAVIRLSPQEDAQLKKMVGNGYIPVKSANLWIIVYPGAKIDVSGDLTGKDFIALYPDCDHENKLFAELNSEMMPLLNDGANLSVKAETNPTMSEAAKKEIEQKLNEIEVKTATIREKFISEHPSCIASLWLMEDMLIRSQIETSKLEPLISRVDKKYFDNYFYVSVKNRIEGAKKAAIGEICPTVKGKDQNGNDFDLISLRSKFVIIDFWGTWCGACLAGMPAMKDFRDKHSDIVQILGVANDKNEEAWKKCIQSKGMNWPNIMQGNGENDFVAKFNVQGFPTKILVSPQGKILYRASGESEDFYKIIEDLILKHKN